MERLIVPTRFVAPAESFEQLLQRIHLRNPTRGDLPAHLELMRVHDLVAQDLQEELPQKFKEVLRNNGQWLEKRFQLLREKESDWSFDGALVDYQGRILAYWTTYRICMADKQLPFNNMAMDVLAGEMLRRGNYLFPLTPIRDSILFWPYDFEKQVVSLLEQTTAEEVQIEDYPVNPQIAVQMPSVVRMGRVRRNILGAARAGRHQVILGSVGFWERSNLGSIKYLPRVRFEKSPLLERQIYISILQEDWLVATGQLPLNEKYNVEVIRPNPDLAQADFITAAIASSYQRFPGRPFAMRFNAYRPWFGEWPQHYGEKLL